MIAVVLVFLKALHTALHSGWTNWSHCQHQWTGPLFLHTLTNTCCLDSNHTYYNEMIPQIAWVLISLRANDNEHVIYVYQSFIYFFWGLCSDPFCVSMIFSFLSSLYSLDLNLLASQDSFSCSVGCLFIDSLNYFCWIENFNFVRSNLPIIGLISRTNRILFRESLPLHIPCRALSTFSPKSFSFGSYIEGVGPLWADFVWGMKDWVSFFYMQTPRFPNIIRWKCDVLSSVHFWHLCQKSGNWKLLIYIPLYRSMSLFLCQYNAAFITMILK